MPAIGYAFRVALTKSWHSAAHMSEADGERVTMMVTYYVADSPYLAEVPAAPRLAVDGVAFGALTLSRLANPSCLP